MRVSNRENDIIASKRMEQIMSAVYAKFGWQGQKAGMGGLRRRATRIC